MAETTWHDESDEDAVYAPIWICTLCGEQVRGMTRCVDQANLLLSRHSRGKDPTCQTHNCGEGSIGLLRFVGTRPPIPEDPEDTE